MNGATQITEISARNFASEVLETSRQVPVLVDFWADWCQPCKQLAPVLEAVAAGLTGKLKLVKVNTDRERELAAQYGIRSLPTVMLFRDGQPVDQFSGVVPQQIIEEFLERYLPRESDALRQQAQSAYATGDQDGAITLLKQALEIDPDNYRIHPELAALLLAAGACLQAEDLLNSLPANQQLSDEVTGLRAQLRFRIIVNEAPDAAALQEMIDKDAGNLDARYQLSAHQVLSGNHEIAMELLLEIIRRDRSYRDEAARKALLDIFTILGNSGDLVKQYRSRLATALN